MSSNFSKIGHKCPLTVCPILSDLKYSSSATFIMDVTRVQPHISSFQWPNTNSMCTWLHICVCVSVFASFCLCRCLRIWVCIYASEALCLYLCVCFCACVFLGVASLCLRASVSTLMRLRLWLCVHVNVFAYLCLRFCVFGFVSLQLHLCHCVFVSV